MIILKDEYIYTKEDVIKYKNAEALYINDDINFVVDLSQFSNLKQLTTNFNNCSNFDSLTVIRFLNIGGLQKKRVEEIAGLISLERIDIIRGNIENLDFLKNLINLGHIELFYLSKLTNIKGLLKIRQSLFDLNIESCKKVEFENVVPLLLNLESLSFFNFQIKNILFVKKLVKLKNLLLLDSNVLDGDISPAKNIHFVAIDNRRNYNYKYNRETKKLVPCIPKEKKKQSTDYKLNPYGTIQLSSLKDTYESDINIGERSVSLDLNFTSSTISKVKINVVKKILDNIISINNNIINYIFEDFQKLGEFYHYIEFLTEEFESKINLVKEKILLKRVGFYPHDHSAYVIFDYFIDDIENNYVFSVKLNNKLQIVEMGIEN